MLAAMADPEAIQQLAQIVQAVINAQLPAPTVPKPPKVATPTPFNGDHEKLDDFLAQCRLYLTLHQVDYPDDLDRILFILSHMKEGTVALWVP
jgi:hypothetical protein